MAIASGVGLPQARSYRRGGHRRRVRMRVQMCVCVCVRVHLRARAAVLMQRQADGTRSWRRALHAGTTRSVTPG